MRRAAAIFIQRIVEEGAYIGIVTFNERAEVKNQLLHMVSDEARENLTSNLPVTSGGGLSICSGITSGLQVNDVLKKTFTVVLQNKMLLQS